MRNYVLAFDTANEVIALGVGKLCDESGEGSHGGPREGAPDGPRNEIEAVASLEVEARRASNTQLLTRIDGLLAECGVGRDDIACVVVGRGPGSFTGVRIAMATAKGIASALGVGLIGVSSLDAVAWEAWATGARGRVLVVADAMRKEVYPVEYDVVDDGPVRQGVDRVVKAEIAAPADAVSLLIAGDALRKYADLFRPCGTLLPENTWAPTGRGLLLALQAAWAAGEADPFDAARHNPAFVLPVYTRLSDAEEAEKVRLAKENPALAGARGSKHITMNDTAIANARTNDQGIAYKPLDAAHVEAVACLESTLMGSDAWNARLVADELGRPDRIWWAAFAADPAAPLAADACLVGYAGGWVVDGDVQILKVAVMPEMRRCGIARELMARVTGDARNLAAVTSSLEVRASNEGAQALYEALGYTRLGVRPRYYSDREDAVIMQAELPLVGVSRDVAGMDIAQAPARTVTQISRPLILAIESSCDETAVAIVDGEGRLVADVVASQVDFHARFGGVVPEIASRKHIEAICGVCEECFEVAAGNLGVAQLGWRDLDSVAVTYAPGLVGALVVGVAFAKGAAWACDVPFIGVNHLEGHLYANKIGVPDDEPAFEPPAVVSLVSGGNTLLVHMKDWGEYVTLGSTIDDAVGEAFDKVAKALGLGYPGGPVISKYAAQGNPEAIAFPRAMLHSKDLQFSLSGLKTAVVTYINGERAAGRELNVADICASFQQAVVDVQVAKAATALEQTGAPTFCLGGGVAANPALRSAYEAMCAKRGVRLLLPPLSSCGDNAGMIALVALDRYRQGKFFGLDADALARADLDEAY